MLSEQNQPKSSAFLIGLRDDQSLFIGVNSVQFEEIVLKFKDKIFDCCDCMIVKIVRSGKLS